MEEWTRLRKEREALARRFDRVTKEVLAAMRLHDRMLKLTKEVETFFVSLEPLLRQHFVKLATPQENILWYDRENVAFFPPFESVTLPTFAPGERAFQNFPGMRYADYLFSPMTAAECKKSFTLGSGNPYLQGSDGYVHFAPDTYHTVILTKETRGSEAHWCWINGTEGWYSSGRKATMIPICRLNGENSTPSSPLSTLRHWLSRGLIPTELSNDKTAKYRDILRLWEMGLIVVAEEQSDKDAIVLKEESFLRGVLSGRVQGEFFTHSFVWEKETGLAVTETTWVGYDVGQEEGKIVDKEKKVPTEPKSAADKRALLMDERQRVRLSQDLLDRDGYPYEVYYDGSQLVDVFINQNGNYVQGYVPAGIYRVASVNVSAKKVLLAHTSETRKSFQRNPACSTTFETFAVSFFRVYVMKPAGFAEEGEESPDYEQAVQELQKETEAMTKRIAVLERGLKALQTVKDPVIKAAPPVASAPYANPPSKPMPKPQERLNTTKIGNVSYVTADSTKSATAMGTATPTTTATVASANASGHLAAGNAPTKTRRRNAMEGELPGGAAPTRGATPGIAGGNTTFAPDVSPTAQTANVAATSPPPDGVPEADDLTFLDWQPTPRPPVRNAVPGAPQPSAARRGAARANDRRAAMAERRAADRRRNRRRPTAPVDGGPNGESLFDRRE